MAQKGNSRTFCLVAVLALVLILLLTGVLILLVFKEELLQLRKEDGEDVKGGTSGGSEEERDTSRFESYACPDKAPNLVRWNPGNQLDVNIVIDGESWLLVGGSATVNTIVIRNGGKLVMEDSGRPIHLKTKNINIRERSELHIGGKGCPYMSQLTITLLGSYPQPFPKEFSAEYDVDFGHKFIGVYHYGGIAIHGPWKLSWTFLEETIQPGSGDTILTLAEDATSWIPGDRIVIASSTRDMHQAEEFDLVRCEKCEPNQIKIKGTRKFYHLGERVKGIDMRAEVGLLTRNIKIHGEMEDSCIGPETPCRFFDFDVFGGQTQVLENFMFARFENFELFNMGQQMLGNYPIHFHRTQKSSAGYVKGLSIHNCFSRCVTVHSAMDLVIEDVVGYDTLGHCFFLEDGNEVNNTFRHNLGLLTKPGTLLPSDRDEKMCVELLDAVHGDYVPIPETDCKGIATFWVEHPDNNYEDNAAAGSEEYGWFFAFPKHPTGPSLKSLPDFHAERSPLGKFKNNRVHANGDIGLLLDRGVKEDDSSRDDPRENQALVDSTRFRPHKGRDMAMPRKVAHIENFIAYNNEQALFARGGDILISNGQFGDNDIGVTFASSDVLPYDRGSHQEITGSRIVGRTGKQESMGVEMSEYPFRGVEIHNGPVLVKDNIFTGFTAVNSSALGFRPMYAGHNSPWNQVKGATFGLQDNKVWFGAPGEVFGDFNLDGDLTLMFHDVDGSVTGIPDSYVVRADNKLMTDSSCILREKWGAAVCKGITYALMFVEAKTFDNSPRLTVQEEGTSASVVFRGSNKAGNQLDLPPSEAEWTSVLAVVQEGKTYRLSWTTEPAKFLCLSLHTVPQGSVVYVVIPYPSGTSVTSVEFDLLGMRGQPRKTQLLKEANGMDEVIGEPNGMKYYFDRNKKELFLKLIQRYPVNGYDYCSSFGCQRVLVNVSY